MSDMVGSGEVPRRLATINPKLFANVSLHHTVTLTVVRA